MPEDGTGKFFGDYISRVGELQQLMKEANASLDELSDEDKPTVFRRLTKENKIAVDVARI